MSPRSYKKLFSRFLEAGGDRLHFAAHSHHYWPDVTFEAQKRAWEDAATHVDRKWDGVLEETLPSARAHIARTLGLSDPRTLAFAVNTHEFVVRILSCFDTSRPVRVLSTSSEFHSFSRQSQRLEEDGLIECVRVPTAPYSTFFERFSEAAQTGAFDLVYVSHVFFDSGFVFEDLEKFVRSVRKETWIVVDGYHGFMALPTQLSAVEDRIFYTAGGYKYAMSGEGVCFLHCPPGYGDRPRNTGWFAAFGSLESGAGERSVPYASDGFRFFGATFDPTAMYRFVAVMDLLVAEGVTVEIIDERVRSLQRLFLERILAAEIAGLDRDCLIPDSRSETRRGHFVTFETKRAAEIHKKLGEARVLTDYRGDRLRFGFGLYHDESDVLELLERTQQILARP